MAGVNTVNLDKACRILGILLIIAIVSGIIALSCLIYLAVGVFSSTTDHNNIKTFVIKNKYTNIVPCTNSYQICYQGLLTVTNNETMNYCVIWLTPFNTTSQSQIELSNYKINNTVKSYIFNNGATYCSLNKFNELITTTYSHVSRIGLLASAIFFLIIFGVIMLIIIGFICLVICKS